MRLTDDVHVLELSAMLGGDSFSVSLSLLMDLARGPTLVDTGFPG
jgi:hypothetical protein